MVDLSYNNLSGYSSLAPVMGHYQHVSRYCKFLCHKALHYKDHMVSLLLSHNQLPSIPTMLLKLQLDKQLRVDHNLITEIPFDISQLLQKYLNNEITLGHNPWSCYCNAEITDLVSCI